MLRSCSMCAAFVMLAASAVSAERNHPRIFITSKDLPRLRATASDTRTNALGYVPAEAWKELQARADAFVAAPPYHRAVSMPGREGSPRKRWEYTLSKEPPPRHDYCRRYPPWTGMFQERADSITTRLKHLLLAYVVTGEATYFERAKEMVFALCAWPMIWTDPGVGTDPNAPSTSGMVGRIVLVR